MEPDQRLTFSREIARASSERDKCFRSLDLERAEWTLVKWLLTQLRAR
jgi:hypothetical protein